MKKSLWRLTILLVASFVLPIDVWADGDVEKVSTTTLWNFDNLEVSDNYATATAVNYNGLYIKGDNDATKNTQIKTCSSLNLGGSTLTYTFHGEVRTTTNILVVNNGRDKGYASISGLETYLQAVETTVPGTMYACIAGGKAKFV